MFYCSSVPIQIIWKLGLKNLKKYGHMQMSQCLWMDDGTDISMSEVDIISTYRGPKKFWFWVTDLITLSIGNINQVSRPWRISVKLGVEGL